MTWLINLLFRWTMPFFAWIEPSMTGNDGAASGRKISSLIFMVLIITTTSKLLLKEDINAFHIYVLVILVSTFLLLQGILTAQNMIDIWKNGKGQWGTKDNTDSPVSTPVSSGSPADGNVKCDCGKYNKDNSNNNQPTQ